MPQLFDTVTMDTKRVRKTRFGYLVADVLAARTGIQDYLGIEVGKPERDIVRVYRPPQEVFDKNEAMRSFTSLPITLDHPPELVTSQNWKRFARGYTGEDVARDGEFVRVPLIVQDQIAIEAVENGQRELSFGYTCDLDFTAGKTEDGQAYDAVQKNLRGNHLAIVSMGRAGSHCSIGDDQDNIGVGLMAGENAQLRTVTVDGIPVSTTDAGAAAITTLQSRLAEHLAGQAQLVTDNKTALTAIESELTLLREQLGARDRELGTLKGELENAKAQATDTTRLDALVAERADLLTKTKAIVGDSFEVSGKSVADIRRGVVAKRLGDTDIKDRSDDYVQALFDSLAKSISPTSFDPVRQAMQHGSQGSTSGAGAAKDAHANMLKRNSEAWRNPFSQARN